MNSSAITKRLYFPRLIPIVPKTTSLLLLGLFVAWTGPSAAFQMEQPAHTSSHDSTYSPVGDLIAQANIFASKYFDNRAALALYSRALSLESANTDLLWHISQAYIDIGEHLPTATDEEKQHQLAMYEKALEFAEKSVVAGGENSMALTRRAIALSRVSLFRGFWETVSILKDVHSDLERAVALDSTNHLAFYVLGKTHMRVTERPWIFRWPLGLGWGSKSDALLSFEAAILLKGDLIEYRVEYAKALIEEGKYEKARAHLLTIPDLPTQDEDDERYRRDARELFETIKDEN